MASKIIQDKYTYYKDKKIPIIPDDILECIKGIVYTITNKKNKKVYVGQTMSHMYFQENDSWTKTGIKDRWRRHVSDAKSYTKQSKFYEDILEFGEENFEVEVYKIIPINEIHKLNVAEFVSINELDTIEPKGYNKDSWKNSMSFTKYIFLKHFDLEDKIPSLNTNTTSRERCQQKCVVQHSILNQFKNKEIEEVDVRIINSKGIPNQARIVVKIKNEHDKYRTSWYISKDPINILKYIIEIAKELKEDAFIDPRIKTIIETGNINSETYKYQKRLDEAIKYEYEKISGIKTYYSSKDFYAYLLILSRKKEKDIRYSFGGKTVNVKDAFNDAKEFINRLTQVKNIPHIKIVEPDENINSEKKDNNETSCPQQQATEKTVELVFLD